MEAGGWSKKNQPPGKADIPGNQHGKNAADCFRISASLGFFPAPV